MDFLYAAVLIFCGIYLLLFLRIKRGEIKRTSKYNVLGPDDLGELFQMYFLLSIIAGFTIYFLLR